MKKTFHFDLTDSPEPKDVQVARDGLGAHNALRGAPVNLKSLTILMRDKQGTVVGGLTGGTYWGWLYMSVLWLEEDIRGQGYGSRILAVAEQAALRRDCHHAYLDTQDFQALPFYEKHGYTVYGELEDMQLGNKRHSMKKIRTLNKDA